MNAIDASDGSHQWTTSLPDYPSGIAFNGGTIYTEVDGVVHALDASDGSHQWTSDFTTSFTDLAAEDGMVYGSTPNYAIAIDGSDGSEEWTYDGHTDWIEGITVSDGTVYTGARDNDLHAIDASDGSEQWIYDGQSSDVNDIAVTEGLVVSGADYSRIHAVGSGMLDPTVTIGDETIIDEDSLMQGETISRTPVLSTGSIPLDVSGTDGDLDVEISRTEISKTVNPALEVNGESFGHDGTLEDGETASIGVDESAVIGGTNTITVRTDTPDTGPESVVGFVYSHSATTDESVSYSGETWSETYDISRTWDDATAGASVTIPFASSRVAEIRDAEKRINNGDWQALESDEIEMDGTTLEVQFGDIDADDEIGVRATGSKVDVSGGEIDVLEPTTEGDTLDTKVEIVDHSDEFAVDVSGTTEGNWLHRTVNESWSAASTSSVFHATGEQEIRAPGASSGSTARVQTLPLEVSPNAGDVAISSVNPSGDELRFDSEPDGATEVDYTWHETNSGERYVLYSDTHGVVRDSATASSPVTLTGSSYDETLQIMSPSDDSGDDEIGAGSGASSSGVSGAVSQATGMSSPIMLIAVGVGLIAGMAVLSSRTRVPTWIVGIGAPLIGLISLEAISPGTISSGISSTIVMVGSAIGDVWSEVGAPVMLIAVMVGAWLVVRWWQTREERATEPDTAVNFNLRDD